MIITENAIKDTYITDLSTQYNKGVDANFGQASTLDLFKIVGENKNVKSRALFKILNAANDLVDNKTFTLKDSSDNSVVFLIDRNSTQADGRVDANGKVIIGIDQVASGVAQLQKVIDVINSVTSFDQTVNGGANQLGKTLTLNITATKLDDSKILLEQNIAGKSGDGVVTHDSSGNFSITPFRRFEHSSILLKFDLASFKANNVTTYGSSAFPSNFKAELKLKDIGSSSVRPKDFKIRLRVLNEDFNEGLGRDTVHFSDLGDANFKTINDKTNKAWTKEGIVTSTDTSSLIQAVFSTLSIEDGSEDIVFDITTYIKHYLEYESSNFSQCFVIDFDHDNMFDANTYFLKRFASRNNFNKNYHPKIEMKIKDTVFDIITYKDKKRYLDNAENFYLTNIIDKSPATFNANLKLEFSYLDTDGLTNILSSNVKPATAVTNYKGKNIPGIKKFTLTDTVIQSTQANTKFKAELIKNGYVDITLKYFYDSSTAAGSADDVIDSDEIILKTETVKFYLPDSNLEVFRNVRVVVDSDHKSMKVNNDFKQLKLSFIDTKKQYDAVKVPVDLISENIGNVNYSMFDIDTGEEIISKDGDYTKLIYNGEYYHLNLYASKNYKNKRVSFIFYYTDYFSGLEKQIFDKSLIIRFE